MPPAWVHPEVGPAYYRTRRGPEAFVAAALWPFNQDSVVADYDSSLPAKWWSHGLVHALVGFGYWPGVSEWEVMHMARLSEAVAAVHWYNLAELGRLTAADVPIDLTDLRGHDAERYASLEREARRALSRREKLEDPSAARIAENALETLRYETFAYRGGMWDGDLLEPDDAYYLGLGEAADYAKVNFPRLMSVAHARWRRPASCPSATTRPRSTASSAAPRPPSRRWSRPATWCPTPPGAARAAGHRLARVPPGHARGQPADGHACAAPRRECAWRLDATSEVAEARAARCRRSAGARRGARRARRRGGRARLALGYRPTLDPAREPATVQGDPRPGAGRALLAPAHRGRHRARAAHAGGARRGVSEALDPALREP
ncbi:MAG: hypothetical protein U1F43_24190 [Myxococcota bacterium]